MLRQIFKCLKQTPKMRLFSTTPVLLHRVTIIGAAGRVGQVVSLLIKTNRSVTDLVLMDIKNTAGIAADLAHLDTFSGCIPFSGLEKMEASLKCSKLVIVTAGVARSEDVCPEALFDANKDLIYDVASLKAKICPEAFLVIVTSPIEALVPLAAETLKQANAYDSKKLFGVSKLDTIRSRTAVGDFLVIDPIKVSVDAVGGHSETTTVPLLSSCIPPLPKAESEWAHLYERVRKASSAIFEATEGKQSIQLGVAYAAASFCGSLLKAMDAKSGIYDVAYVESEVNPAVKFFSSKVDLGKEGIQKFHSLPKMNPHEKDLILKAIPHLKSSIEKGIEYAQSKKDEN